LTESVVRCLLNATTLFSLWHTKSIREWTYYPLWSKCVLQ
jgi:hypothetical protein